MLDPASGERLKRRIGATTALTALIANFDGAAVIFVYLTFVAPGAPSGTGSVTVDLVQVAVYSVVAAVVLGVVGYRDWSRRLAWLGDGRSPTLAERQSVLKLPWVSAARPFVVWIVGAAFFGCGGLLSGDTAHQAAKNTSTILLGGLITAAITFLRVETKCRPLFALALEGEAPEIRSTFGIRPRLMLAWALGSGIPLAGLVMLPLMAEHATERTDIRGAVVVVGTFGLAAGLLMMRMASKSVADPLSHVRDALDQITAGSLDVSVPVDDAGEIGVLQSGVNQMVAGLRERHRLEDLFGRQVGPDVARLALEQGTGLVSETREASALFVDLLGSTAMAEVLSPAEVVETLNAYFDTVVREVNAEGGWVNKFEGDGALCVFGAPANQPDHAASALRAARKMDAALRALAHDYPGIDAAIGVSSGSLVAGNVGTAQRYEYTVIGRPVNEAARLSDIAKGMPARVVASNASIERAGEEANRWRSLGTVALRGQSAPSAIYAPADVREPVPTT